ncbi:MAG: hypothetical protein E7635_02080 [Ruminococcaceae bacterium]|nr:hypothetical protein [Oscillospiraceae bacterium]
MKLLFKQRFFSWLDSYDIYDESGDTVFTVEGKLAFTHTLHVLNKMGEHIGTVKREVFTFLPKFGIYKNDMLVGYVSKQFSLFSPSYNIDFNGWQVSGDIFEWDYTIKDAQGYVVATVSKELFNFTDTYVIDVANPENAIDVLMFTLAIDAEKCSRK